MKSKAASSRFGLVGMVGLVEMVGWVGLGGVEFGLVKVMMVEVVSVR